MNVTLPMVSYEDRSSHVVGSAVVLIILPTVAVTLRLLSRWMSGAGLWVCLEYLFRHKPLILDFLQVDDYTAILSVCAVSVVRLVLLAGVDQSDITWNYVPAAIWSAAEPSIAVVSACLPSLRPLFVRLVWGGTHRTKSTPLPHKGMQSWRSKSVGGGGTQGSFNRLQELSKDGAQSSWRHNSVAVFGGKGDEEYGDDTDEVPWNRIRAKTEVVLTISERVDWQDDLF
ncbi:MAG: hypothetical protein Q9213_005433 [Squamulea squamosa]